MSNTIVDKNLQESLSCFTFCFLQLLLETCRQCLLKGQEEI